MHDPSTAAGRRRPDAGFSLIELMIVLLIVAILLAVAIPTYLSARNRAENRAAQELLSNAAQAELVAQMGPGGAVSPGGDGAKHLEVGLGPGVQLFYEFASMNAAGQISFFPWIAYGYGPGSGVAMKLASWSPAGVCWMATAAVSAVSPIPAGVRYGAYTAPLPSDCSEAGAPTTGWQASWSAASAKL